MIFSYGNSKIFLKILNPRWFLSQTRWSLPIGYFISFRFMRDFQESMKTPLIPIEIYFKKAKSIIFLVTFLKIAGFHWYFFKHFDKVARRGIRLWAPINGRMNFSKYFSKLSRKNSSTFFEVLEKPAHFSLKTFKKSKNVPWNCNFLPDFMDIFCKLLRDPRLGPRCPLLLDAAYKRTPVGHRFPLKEFILAQLH